MRPAERLERVRNREVEFRILRGLLEDGLIEGERALEAAPQVADDGFAVPSPQA